MELLNRIQRELKAPKGQFNSFGKYHYRNCEDILEAVKPLLGDGVLTLSDEIVQLGDRYYVKATATLTEGKPLGVVSVTAYAREALDKKGMDEAQITGAASSYARKYALNGLFCIDDTKDADSDAPKQETQKVEAPKPTAKPVPPKSVTDLTKQRKTRVKELVDGRVLVPLETKQEYEDFVKQETTLDLIDSNLVAIIERLEALERIEGIK